MAIIISVQGNIGSGKSTLVAKLKEVLGVKKRICFLQEPVSEWEKIRDSNNTSILELFYGNQEEYAFQFQMMAYISRLAILKRALKSNYDIIITERSLATDKNVFCQMLYDSGKIKDVEFQIYNKWFDEFQSEFPYENIVYIQTDPEVAHERVAKRAREGESTIPLEYLADCHRYHENWIDSFSKSNVLVLDGNQDIHKNPNTINDWELKINQFISRKQSLNQSDVFARYE
uniref:Deoxynucleoside kinase domain-containing protein n=1 Tax=viral metagenome TaxID=1070528 RepID=A0A6C0LLR0_9ZZZZ